MDHEAWHARWSENRIGFHKAEVNDYLPAFLACLDLKPGDSVFVPLCGKSVDMGWLAAEGYRVIGVEISPIAVSAFFRENRLDFERERRSRFEIWRGAGIELLCGDFFDVGLDDLHGVTATFDRASLVAVPAAMRARYAQHLLAILPRGTPILLVTLEYAQHEMKGPPFSVLEDEVHSLFGHAFEIEPLSSREILDEEPHFRKKGLTRLTEKVFLLTTAGSAP